MLHIEYGDVVILIPNDLVPALTELAFTWGYGVADRLQTAEEELAFAEDSYIDVDSEYLQELTDLLTAVVR